LEETVLDEKSSYFLGENLSKLSKLDRLSLNLRQGRIEGRDPGRIFEGISKLTTLTRLSFSFSFTKKDLSNSNSISSWIGKLINLKELIISISSL